MTPLQHSLTRIKAWIQAELEKSDDPCKRALLVTIEAHEAMLEALSLVEHKFERAGGIWAVANRGVELGAMSWASNVENGLANIRSASESALTSLVASLQKEAE